jgi:hypothetical protein
LALPPQEITSVLDEIALLRSNFSAPPLNSLNIRAVLKLLVLLNILDQAQLFSYIYVNKSKQGSPAAFNFAAG